MRASWGDRGDRNLDQMESMAARLGARPGDDYVSAVEWGYAVRRCVFCAAGEDCAEWLESGVPDECYRDFCPNASFFERQRG